MTIPHNIAVAAGEALSSVRAGDDTLASVRLVRGTLPELSVTSKWFTNGGNLPTRCSVDGEGVPPPLSWSQPPLHTRSLVLICEDPDAPTPAPFVHWLVYGIEPTIHSLDTSLGVDGREGKNSKLKSGFTPAAPPPGHGVHHYHFQLFALNAPLGLGSGEGRSALIEAMEGHVIGFGEVIGTYERH